MNRYLLLTSKPMIYLINLSKEDYLAGKAPLEKETEDAVTFNGKYQAKVIKYSVEYEQEREKEEKGEVENIIQAAYQ